MTNVTPELLKHIETNLPIYEVWITNNEQLQYSHDILAPLIPVFEERFPEISVKANCNSCIIEMLIWAKNLLKKSKTHESKPKKK